VQTKIRIRYVTTIKNGSGTWFYFDGIPEIRRLYDDRNTVVPR
jgi:hypothetical protein